MNNDGKFDIDLSQLDGKIEDTNPFSDRELPSINAMNKFISSKHELKNQSSTFTSGNFFVEYGMLVDGVYTDTGILTSEAVLQTYNVFDTIYSFSTEFILWCYHNRKKQHLKDSKKNDSNYVASGFLLPIERLPELYRNYYKEIRLKSLKLR